MIKLSSLEEARIKSGLKKIKLRANDTDEGRLYRACNNYLILKKCNAKFRTALYEVFYIEARGVYSNVKLALDAAMEATTTPPEKRKSFSC